MSLDMHTPVTAGTPTPPASSPWAVLRELEELALDAPCEGCYLTGRRECVDKLGGRCCDNCAHTSVNILELGPVLDRLRVALGGGGR